MNSFEKNLLRKKVKIAGISLICYLSYFQLVSKFSKLKLTIINPRKVSVDSGPAEKMRQRMNKQRVAMRDLDVGI